MLRAGLAILIVLAALGAIAACLSLAVVVNLRGWTRRLADRASELGRNRQGVVGLLFRGRYPTLLVRVMALQALAVALLFPGALSYAIGMPGGLFFAPMVVYILAFLAAVLWSVAAQRSSGIHGTAAPIVGVVMFALFVVVGLTFTAFGNMTSFLFGRDGHQP